MILQVMVCLTILSTILSLIIHKNLFFLQTESGMNDEDINKQPLIDLVKTVLASTGE